MFASAAKQADLRGAHFQHGFFKILCAGRKQAETGFKFVGQLCKVLVLQESPAGADKIRARRQTFARGGHYIRPFLPAGGAKRRNMVNVHPESY